MPQSATKKAGSAPTPTGWKENLHSYREKRALRFSTEKEADAAIDLIWKKKELYGMPRAIVDADTIIVPAEAVPFFKESGLSFSASRVVPADELTADEITRLRQEQGIF